MRGARPRRWISRGGAGGPASPAGRATATACGRGRARRGAASPAYYLSTKHEQQGCHEHWSAAVGPPSPNRLVPREQGRAGVH
jgi:hypothetical protein